MCEKLHTYKYLHRKCCERGVIVAAWKKLRKGKTTRREVIKIEADFDYYVDKMQTMIRNTRPRGDPDLQFWPEKHKARTVFEHGKEREIFCPTIWEQWVHHIVIQVLSPIVTRYAYKDSCGSMPKRGGVYGKRRMERLIAKGFRYFAKLDIRHFFKSVRQDIVVGMLEELICDEWFIYLIRRIFWQFPRSLPLGFYPSQWLANFVLCPVEARPPDHRDRDRAHPLRGRPGAGRKQQKSTPQSRRSDTPGAREDPAPAEAQLPDLPLHLQEEDGRADRQADRLHGLRLQARPDCPA